MEEKTHCGAAAGWARQRLADRGVPQVRAVKSVGTTGERDRLHNPGFQCREINFQEVQETQRVPKKLDPRRNTRRHIIITLAKFKEKERILKAAREKETPTKEFP